MPIINQPVILQPSAGIGHGMSTMRPGLVLDPVDSDRASGITFGEEITSARKAPRRLQRIGGPGQRRRQICTSTTRFRERRRQVSSSGGVDSASPPRFCICGCCSWHR